MEARDALADIGWSMRPRARRVPEAGDMVAVGAGLAIVVAVATAALSGLDSSAPAADGVWVPIGLGLAGANVVALVAGWWSGRQVHPCRLVPLLFGLAYLAPTTLLLVDLVAALAVHLSMRPDRPKRALADAALRVAETGAAIVVFRSFAAPALDAPRTWSALALAVAVGAAVRLALQWGLALESATVPRTLVVRLADGGAVVLGAVIGIGALGLSVSDDAGVTVAVVGTLGLMLGSFLTARHERQAAEAIRLARMHARVVDSIHRHDVVGTAVSAIRELVLADLAAHIGPTGVATVAGDFVADEDDEDDDAVVGEVSEHDHAAVLRPLLDVLPTGVGSILVHSGELQELRAATGLSDQPLHVIYAPVADDGHASLVLAFREHANSNPFTVAERKLLEQATSPIASAFVASEKLARYQRQARFDELTGLPSRVNLEDSIAVGVEESRLLGTALAVLLVDLNGFKEVNDTLGHQTGDVVLAEIGERIASFADEVDAVGRLGGDEFVLLLSGEDHDEVDRAAREISEGLAAAIARPIAHGDLVLDIGISVGMARYPAHGETPSDLIRAADVAMYAAKAKGVTFTPYEGKLDRHRSRRLGLATDLRAALAADQLEVFFQPKVSFLDGELVGAEALIRWTHPTLRAIPAGEIIEIAEHAGLLRAVTDFVLDRAARQVVALRAIDCDVTIAVNLTERDIADPGFPDRFRHVLESHGLTPDAISLEVTETALLTQEVEALGVLPKMSEMGVHLAIDDFGTGFSSLSHLRKFPVDEIKIDMSFVERMVIRPNDAVIVRSIVELGHSLGLRIVAEGVETNEAWAMLEGFGTDIAQGNHVMKAIDADSFLLWAPFWDRHREQRGFLTHGDERPALVERVVTELDTRTG